MNVKLERAIQLECPRVVLEVVEADDDALRPRLRLNGLVKSGVPRTNMKRIDLSVTKAFPGASSENRSDSGRLGCGGVCEWMSVSFCLLDVLLDDANQSRPLTLHLPTPNPNPPTPPTKQGTQP